MPTSYIFDKKVEFYVGFDSLALPFWQMSQVPGNDGHLSPQRIGTAWRRGFHDVRTHTQSFCHKTQKNIFLFYSTHIHITNICLNTSEQFRCFFFSCSEIIKAPLSHKSAMTLHVHNTFTNFDL